MMNLSSTLFLCLIALLSTSLLIRAEDYDDRALNQWWSDYSSLDDYDDEDLDRHMNLIITKNILPGDAPLPFDEALFYRRQSSSSEEFDFAPPPPVAAPRRNPKSKKNLISSSTRPPSPPPPPPPETFRPRPSPKPSRKPIFRPNFSRPPPTLPPSPPPPEDDTTEEEDEIETPSVPTFVRPDLLQQPAVLSDSQNVFVTRGTEAPKERTGPNRIPVSFSDDVRQVSRAPQFQPQPQPQPQPQLLSRSQPSRSQSRVNFIPPTPTKSSTSFPPVFPSTFRPRNPDFSLDAGLAPPPPNFPPNSAVFVPPSSESFTSRSSPITRQSLATNDFFSSPTTASFSTFESQTPQGRRTQVLKRRFRPSTRVPEEPIAPIQNRIPIRDDEALATPLPSLPLSSPPSSPSYSSTQFRPERRRVRINSDLNNFQTTSFALESNVPKKKVISNVNKRPVNQRNRQSTPFESISSLSSLPNPSPNPSPRPQPSTVGRLLEPQRIPTTYRPQTVAVKKEVIRKKVSPSSSFATNTVSPSFVRRRPVVITTPSPFSDSPSSLAPPSPDVEVRGRVRVPVTTSIPQLFLSTPLPNEAHHHTPIDGEISSNTEIISPADLREVARQHQREHANIEFQRSQRSSSTRFQRDETRRRNAILAAHSSSSQILQFDVDDDIFQSDQKSKVNLTDLSLDYSSLYSWTPSCYDGRRSFCLYDQQYPSELIDEIIRQRDTELTQLIRQLGIGNETDETKDESNDRDKFVCESVAQSLRPGWAKDALTGKWLVVVNSQDTRFRQIIRVETCTRRDEPCHFISPYYRSSCVERENVRRLVAINPRDVELKPFVALFSVPCGCACRIGSVHERTNSS